MPKKGTPPGLKSAKCCGTCEQWEWGYEGEGKCRKYPDFGPRGRLIYYPYSINLCDDWKLNSKEKA